VQTAEELLDKAVQQPTADVAFSAAALAAAEISLDDDEAMTRLHDAADAMRAAARKADELVERINAEEAAEDGSSDDE